MKQARTHKNEEDGSAKIQQIPEECLAKAISLTSPPDACRVAAVSTAFRTAADSNTVWERFLPPDYNAILERAVHPDDISSKKELFLNLSEEHILIDDGKISFGLDRSSGAKCYMLSTSEVGIAWMGTDIYWRRTSDPDSRFSEVAELVSVCWFNVHGCINSSALSANTRYAAYLVFKLAHNARGLNSLRQRSFVEVGRHRVCIHTAEGSKCYMNYERDNEVGKPIKLHGWGPGHGSATHTASLHPCKRASCCGDGDVPSTAATTTEPHEHEEEEAGCVVRYPRPRMDGWMELEMGEFYIEGDTVGNVDMILQEVDELHWKTGLIIEGIEIRPKN